jgi:TAG lipase / steryl ester hydrolase / phospholipase A2 / LPA acyltransferase
VPGLFPPIQLDRRLADGSIRPYLPEERWIDGSMVSDVPTQRVGRLHNVNHFIVSQTNPHVVPFVRHGSQQGVMGFARRILAGTVHRQGVQAVSILRDVAGSTRAAPAVDVAHALWAQAYGGDINIVPPMHPAAYLRTVSNPSLDELKSYILNGERGAWPHIARIRDAMRVARALDLAVRTVRATR